jgi:iron(III) transport system substrate-binding protein
MLTRMLRTACLALAAVVVLSALPALAQKQTVVVYTAIENEQVADYMKSLNKTLPNLDIKMLGLSTGDIAARFMAEKDNMQADAIWGVGATNILIFKDAGLLEPYAPKGLDKIQGLFRDKANPPSWIGTDIYMSAFCVNTDVSKKNNLPMPASWADLTKPVYKGQIVMPNSASLGTGYLSVASILQRMGKVEGWKYLDALDKNIAEYTKSGSKPCKDAAAGERAIGVSFEYVKNPAAKQFLDWAASDEAMALYAKYFAAVGVAGMPVPEGLPKDITKVVYPNDFEWSAKNRDRILAEWQNRYAK